MQGQIDKTIWRRVGLIAILLLVCFFFPFALILVGFLAWTIYEDLKPPQHPHVPPPRTWRDVKPEDRDWLGLFCKGCESPAEEQFLRAMVTEFDLKPSKGKLISPTLTLEIQVKFANYRFDFLANGNQVIEVDGATYHSSPEQLERDRIRDEYSIQSGYKVLRIPASIVFKAPDETLRRVKAAIAKTPDSTKPAIAKAVSRKTFTQYIDAFSEKMERLNRSVEIMRVKQLATADFRSAISTEQIFLDALISQVEQGQRFEALSSEERKFHDEMLNKIKAGRFGEAKIPLSEIYSWKQIIKPAPVEDPEIQRQIEGEYASAIDERNKLLAKLKDRCVEDPVFAQLLYRKMKEANFPEADAIHVVPAVRNLESL